MSEQQSDESALQKLTEGKVPPIDSVIPNANEQGIRKKESFEILVESLTDLSKNIEAKTRISSQALHVYRKGLIQAVRYGPIDESGFPSKENILFNTIIQELKLAVSVDGQRVTELIEGWKAEAKLQLEKNLIKDKGDLKI